MATKKTFPVEILSDPPRVSVTLLSRKIWLKPIVLQKQQFIRTSNYRELTLSQVLACVEDVEDIEVILRYIVCDPDVLEGYAGPLHRTEAQTPHQVIRQ